MYKFNLSTLFRLQVRHLGGSIPAEMQSQNYRII